MPRIASEGLCRGEGQGYVALAIKGYDGPLNLRARTSDGVEVPSALRPLASAGARNSRRVAIVVPLINRDLVLELWLSRTRTDAPNWSATFPVNTSKLSSRLLTARKPQLARELRGIEDRCTGGYAQLTVTDIWPAGSNPLSNDSAAHEPQAIWRVQTCFPTVDEATPRIVAFDARANQIALEAHVMEDHVVASKRDPRVSEHIVTFSVLLPQSANHVCLAASIEDRSELMAFRCLLPWQVDALVATGRKHVGGAAWDDRYPLWLNAHRATPAELDRQRTTATSLPSDAPLISVVMPVYRTPTPFLEEAIASVRAQTYPLWELVVANASGPWPEVDEVLERAGQDERVRVIGIENRSIAENTNAAISATTGDYVAFLDHDDLLEPDALWRYATCIRERRETDLLYCDEDRLAPDGTPCLPAFKPGPNHGLLLGYNYVTHLLCVSRRVLNLTERSGPSVAGAQDFDLTLKAFEVAREIAHVPYVLYHWREHDSSTAGDASQKPFAHDAGRVALEGHLARTGLLATVEDGPFPCTYRVRHELPDPKPLVSIIIPTRDHVELLATCIRSILERTDYTNYEVILVDTGSVEARTFRFYDELKMGDGRVRLTTWKPSTGTEEPPFDYSSIVNHGARHASGELLCFLNNDTEVLSERWLDSMVAAFCRPEIGVAGAKLLYDDGLVQHVGMAANPNGELRFLSENLTAEEPGYAYTCVLPWDPPMVGGPCQMVRKPLFEELGGYDEQLSAGYSDGDLCLRAREAGWEVTVVPDALLLHRGFASHGYGVTDARLRTRYLAERGRFMARHAAYLADGAPQVNPNLNPYSPWFELG